MESDKDPNSDASERNESEETSDEDEGSSSKGDKSKTADVPQSDKEGRGKKLRGKQRFAGLVKDYKKDFKTLEVKAQQLNKLRNMLFSKEHETPKRRTEDKEDEALEKLVKNLIEKEPKDVGLRKVSEEEESVPPEIITIQPKELSGPTELSSTEPEPRSEEIKHSKVIAETATSGPFEPLEMEPQPLKDYIIKQRVYDIGKGELSEECKITVADEEADKSPDSIIITRPNEEDLEGLTGPTEATSTEPEPLEETIKSARVFSGKATSGPSESPDMEPHPQSEYIKHQKVYNIGVIQERKEVPEEKPEEDLQLPEGKVGTYYLKGPTEPLSVEPQIVEDIKQGRVYAETAQRGPCEESAFEPDLQASNVKQTKIYMVGSRKKVKGISESYTVEPIFSIYEKNRMTKLSDRLEFLARPRKDFLDSLNYKRPDGTLPTVPLPSWCIVPLCTKLPVDKYPYDITMTKVNSKIFLPPPGEEMDLLSKDQPIETYNSLLDPWLKPYFKKESIKEHLKKNGLITDDERLKCSAKEINRYRFYHRKILAKEAQNLFRERDVAAKRKREEEMERYKNTLAERQRKKSERSQPYLRKLILDMVSRTKEGSMENQIVRDCKTLNAFVRRENINKTRTRPERYDRIYQKHLKEKYNEEDKRKAEMEMVKKDLNRLERLRNQREMKKLQRKKKEVQFWNRKAIAQIEWLEEGVRLDNKFRKQRDARILFQREWKRLPSILIPADKQDIKNKIHLLSMKEAEDERKILEEETLSHSEYISRDKPGIHQEIGEDSFHEKEENVDEESPKSAEITESMK